MKKSRITNIIKNKFKNEITDYLKQFLHEQLTDDTIIEISTSVYDKIKDFFKKYDIDIYISRVTCKDIGNNSLKLYFGIREDKDHDMIFYEFKVFPDSPIIKETTDINEYNNSCAATVGDLIRHLQKNFKPDDKLCFWYEGGAYMNCENIPDDYIGERMFRYVKDCKRDSIKNHKYSKKQVDDDYKYVSDNDVLVI